MNKFKVSALICCLFCITCTETCKEFWKSVRVVPFVDHGWFYDGNKQGLAQIIKDKKIQIAVELGTWLGSSAFFIANRLEPGAILYCVDMWQCSDSMDHYHDVARELKEDQFHKFLSNVKHLDLTEKIIPVRMTTDEAARALDIEIDLLYVDASHDEESVYNDMCNWYPKLKPDGVMCGDDYNSWPGVAKAVRRFARKHNKKVCVNKLFWWLE